MAIIGKIKKINKAIWGYIFFCRDLCKYSRQLKGTTSIDKFPISRKFLYPCLLDRFSEAGNCSSYFWQDLWCAKLVLNNNPTVHYDIGSRVDGFIGHLATFRSNIILIDVRPLNHDIPGVRFIKENATELSSIKTESIESISALCSLEHFGLGRYGDDIDPDGYLKVLNSIKRVLAKGGHCYIAVPIGKERVEFNAHRVFYPSTITEVLSPLRLIEFSTTYDSPIIYNDDINGYNDDTRAGGHRFGLFHFVKE